MKNYVIDLTFDPPPDPNLTPEKWNNPEHDHDYVHMRIECSSKRCAEWLRDLLLTTSVIGSSICMCYDTKEIEIEDEE